MHDEHDSHSPVPPQPAPGPSPCFPPNITLTLNVVVSGGLVLEVKSAMPETEPSGKFTFTVREQK